MAWFGVRCVIEFRSRGVFEERVTVWRAQSHEGAIGRAEDEARAYADDDGNYVGFAQSFELYGEPADGVEVFSLMRASSLDARAYVDRFFATGAEREQRADL